jgi:hypothetical protein
VLPLGHIHVDQTGALLIYGYTAEAIAGATGTDLFQPQALQSAAAIVRLLLASRMKITCGIFSQIV